MPKNAKKGVYKEKEFEMYVLWKSIPAYFRGMKEAELFSQGFTDPLVMKIAKIQNQTAFAKKFRIKDMGTLTDWNARIKKNEHSIRDSHAPLQKKTLTLNKQQSSLANASDTQELLRQRKLVSQLRRENALLKKQLRISEKEELPTMQSEPQQASDPISIPAHPPQVGTTSFYKKALSFFKGKM